MQDSSHTHREIVAAVASLKSCLRSVILAVSPPASSTAAPQQQTASDTKIQGSIQRANDAVTKLAGLLSAVADQTLRLPLETSTRLVDVGLPDLLQQLLNACQIDAQWPAVPQCPPSPPPAPADTKEAATSKEAPTAAGECVGSTAATAPAAHTAPAALHPSWAPVQQLLQAVFSTLAVLTSVLIRACTRSADPAMVLMQLASPAVMEAQVVYMKQLREHAAAGALKSAPASPGSPAADTPLSAQSIQSAPACVAAFSSIYGLLAAATDAQAGLEDLRQQLISSLCSTDLLPVAADVLLLVPTLMPSEQQHSHEVEADCQAAGWSLLTLSVFLSGASITINPASTSLASMQPGQPLPSSMLAASIRAEAADAALDLAAAFAAAVEPSAMVLQEQLLSPPVLSLLLERLYHSVTELRGSFASSAALSQQQTTLREASAAQQQFLLPGRCCPADHDVLHAALRALRCWRVLLLSPAARDLPLNSSYGVQLLLTLLSGALAEPIRAASSDRAALRGRVIRVAVHCLQLLCSCINQDVLLQQLPAMTTTLAGVVMSAGAYWDSNKRAIKSEALPYTGQVRCVDKATGEMMVRYTMAAQSALDLLRQLLHTCSRAAPEPDVHAQAGRVASVMVAAGVLPAMEQLLRQVPVVSPAHVTGAVLLVDLLPLCINSELTAGQLPLLASLRKFIVKSVGIPEPDREAAMSTATQVAALLTALAAAHRTSCGSGAGGSANADVLVQHAVVQLLPALQGYVSATLKAPIPAPYSTPVSTCNVAVTAAAALSSSGTAGADPMRTHLLPVMLQTYQQLSALSCAAPQLQLGQLLLSGQVLASVTEILSSNYWLLPGFVAAATSTHSSSGRFSPASALGVATTRGSFSSPSCSGGSFADGYLFTGGAAVQLSVQLLENLLGAAAIKAGPSTAGRLAAAMGDDGKGMRTSCSADCLCALNRSEGGPACRIGNPKCGIDGWCCCGSPKACSDITSPTAPPTCNSNMGLAVPHSTLGFSSTSGDVGPQTQPQWQPSQQPAAQLLLVTSALLQSRLLPELQRAVQQLGGSAEAMIEGSLGSKGSWSRPASATGLTVNVPSRRGSLQKDARGGSPIGVSPKGYSPLGHSAPATATALSTSLRSQTSATQSFLSAYMGDAPVPALGAGSASTTSTSSGLRLTATGTSRFASTGGAGASAGAAAAGSSPRCDDGAFGLLRAGSSGSTINWTAGTSLLQEAGVRVVVRDSSSGFGSSPSLASLASPHAASGFEGSPFVTAAGSEVGCVKLGSATGEAATAAARGGSQLLQQRLEALLLSIAQCTLVLADAGMLGPGVLQRVSSASAGGSERGGADSAPGSAVHASSSPVAASGQASSSATLARPLGSVGSGSAAMYSSYLQGTASGPRNSFSGSGPFGTGVSADEVLAGIRSCLAAVGAAAAVVPGSSDAGGAGARGVTVAQQGSAQLVERLGSASAAGASPPASAGDAGGQLSAEPSSSDVIFPVELGLTQLNIRAGPTAADAAAAPAAPLAPPCTPATPAVPGPWLPAAAARSPAQHSQRCLPGVPADVARRLQGALAAAAPLLARHSGAVEAEVLCSQVLLAQLNPRPVGCWNPSCTNMPGVSEAVAPSKPCASCKVAAFCSKGCEKKAWPDHTMACSKLAALAAAAGREA